MLNHLRLPSAWPLTQSGRRALFDFLVIFSVAAVATMFAIEAELFEAFYEFSRAHEDWELDEIAVMAATAGFAFIVFGLRRLQDQRRELALRLAAERHATLLAVQDSLTGMPNRRRFTELLSSLVDQEGVRNAVIVLDLDRFKPVNDLFGHAIGDNALQTVGQRLKSLGDKRIFSARLGGDEFALIIRDLARSDELEKIAARVIAAIEIPIQAAGVEHCLEVSLGITEIDASTKVAEEFIRRADIALYRAKEQRGSAYAFYDETMDTERREAVRLEKALREALDAGAVVPYYQPIVDLRTGKVLKLEALARWIDGEGRNIPPGVFVPLAESRGLVGDLTEAILRQACADAATWPSDITLSVNLSPMLLQDRSFGLRLMTILSETRLPGQRLQIEITEQALKEDYDVIRPFLDNLRSLGVSISLDDFGTGYSNLSRLRLLPFDNIKIDRSFVQGIADNADRVEFVRTILQLGNGLGMSVTAEGVEDTGQMNSLVAEGCTQGQGFLFSQAVPAGEVAALLGEARRGSTSAAA